MVFDMADEGVKAMVDGWADNTEYTATVTVKTGAGPQRNVAEVTSFTPDEQIVEEPEEKSMMKEHMAEGGKKMGGKMPSMKY
jgi:hypothetical protein